MVVTWLHRELLVSYSILNGKILFFGILEGAYAGVGVKY